jgi:hypothetical protein
MAGAPSLSRPLFGETGRGLSCPHARVSRTRFAQIALVLELPQGFIGPPLLRVSGEGTQASVIPKKTLDVTG